MPPFKIEVFDTGEQRGYGQWPEHSKEFADDLREVYQIDADYLMLALNVRSKTIRTFNVILDRSKTDELS